MNMPSDDRLRAFLERNRNRISHHSHSSSLHILDKDILGPLNNEDIDKCIEVNKSIQRDSTLCGENNNKGNEYEIEKESRNIQTNKKQVQKENNPQSSSAYFSIISSELMGNNMLNQTPKKTLSQKYLKPSLLKGFGSNKILSMTLDSTGKFTDSSKKRLMSNSPSCSSPFENSIGIMKNKNFIETYIHKRKVTRNKMRARVRSLSTESGNSFRSLKFNLGTLNKSTIKQKPFESTSVY